MYTGTHDNATSTSWWESLEDHVKKSLQDNHNIHKDPSWNLIEIGMQTKASLFISPIQDILSLDDSCRLNTPGTTVNNWRWILNKPLEKIEQDLKKYSELGKAYGRL